MSPIVSATNVSTLASINPASAAVSQPPFASASTKAFVNFDCAFEIPPASFAASGFFWFLP
jgi:hypothetical protein